MQHTGSLTCMLHLLSNNEFSMLTNLCGRRLHRLIMDHILVCLQKSRDSAIFSDYSKSSIISFLIEEYGDDKSRSCIKRLEKQYLNCLFFSQISECYKFLPHVSLTLLVIFKQAAF